MDQNEAPTATPEDLAAEWMNDSLDKGSTVTITTHHISIKITPKIRDSFRAAGMEIIYIIAATSGCAARRSGAGSSSSAPSKIEALA